MAGANFFIQNNVTSTSDAHSRWKFVKDSGGNWTLTMPKSFGSAMYVGVFVQDDSGNNISGLSEGVTAISSDPTIISVSNVGGHGFQLSSKGVVGTCYLTVTIPGTAGSVIPNGMTQIVRISTTNLATADWQNMSPILDHFVGSQVNVAGYQQYGSDTTVSGGATVEIAGEKYVEIHSGNIAMSVGSQVTAQRKFDISVTGGEHLDVQGRLGASYLEFYSPEVNPRYVQDLKNGSYNIYMLSSQKSVDFTTQARPNEPEVDISEVEVMFGDSVSIQRTGGHSFRMVAEELGESQVMLTTETGEGQTLINVTVLDEYPDTVLVKNGSSVSLDKPAIIIQRKVLLNNNAHSINMDASVVFEGDVKVDQGNNVVVSKDYHIFLSGGTNVVADGYKAIIHSQKIDNGNNVQIDGSVVWTDDLTVDNGLRLNLVDGHRVPTSGGALVSLFGWKEEPHHEIVVGGANTQVIPGQIIVGQAVVSSRAGADVNVHGQTPADIRIGYRFVTSVFRGIQMEEDDVVIENPATITLTGVAVGGTMPDVAMPCLVFNQSMVEGREFVKGQITEIPEISLDSSIKLGVKLYSCDNALVNPTTFASAYFTFDDELFLQGNLDPVKSLIDVIATPNDLAILMRKKVYVMNVHVVDKQGNPSIVLTRKLRFI